MILRGYNHPNKPIVWVRLKSLKDRDAGRLPSTFSGAIPVQKGVDSILKCNRMLKEYLKRSFEIKAFPWAMV